MQYNHMISFSFVRARLTLRTMTNENAPIQCRCALAFCSSTTFVVCVFVVVFCVSVNVSLRKAIACNVNCCLYDCLCLRYIEREVYSGRNTTTAAAARESMCVCVLMNDSMRQYSGNAIRLCGCVEATNDKNSRSETAKL